MASDPALLVPPTLDREETSRYVIRARPRRMFHTVLDAADLVDPQRPGSSSTTTRVFREGGRARLEFSTEQKLRSGTLVESLLCDADGGLVARRFERTMTDDTGVETRHERADFGRGPVHLPRDTYPEVCLPFLLRWQPFDRTRRSVHAWIADRMVARVYYEVSGRSTIDVPAGRFDVWDVLMYPDLNDWVKLPRIVADLGKPFMPKYHMAYELRAPNRLVRFEGPYGPPGAPELVLELA